MVATERFLAHPPMWRLEVPVPTVSHFEATLATDKVEKS